jgi:hypothetical protein
MGRLHYVSYICAHCTDHRVSDRRGTPGRLGLRGPSGEESALARHLLARRAGRAGVQRRLLGGVLCALQQPLRMRRDGLVASRDDRHFHLGHGDRQQQHCQPQLHNR